MSKDLVEIPHVTTLAKPQGQDLIAARHEVQRNKRVQKAFLKHKGTPPSTEAAQKLAAEVAPLLSEKLNGDMRSVALYLADEYLQIGDAVLVIDPKTGRAIAKVTDEDFWTPEAVPREDGRMVPSASRLRPDLQGILLRWLGENDREEQALAALSTRIIQTPLEIENGSRRLLASTRSGRKTILEELNSLPISHMMEALRGSLRSFTDRWSFERPDPDIPYKSFLGLRAISQTSLGIQDWKTRNMSFDITSSFRSVLAAGWVRDIARTLIALTFNEKTLERIDFQSVPSRVEASKGFLWVAEGHGAWHLRKMGYESLSVGNASDEHPEEKVLLLPPGGTLLGHIVLSNPKISHREIHDRWDVFGTLDYDLYVDFGPIVAVDLRDLPEPTVQALVLR